MSTSSASTRPTTSTTTTRTQFTGKQILEALRKAGLLEGIPNEGTFIEEVYVEIPGGGDWSNMDLIIDEDNPVVVKVVQTSYSSI